MYNLINAATKRPAENESSLIQPPLKKIKVESAALELPEEIIFSIFYQLLYIHVNSSAYSLSSFKNIGDLSLVSKRWKKCIDKTQIKATISFFNNKKSELKIGSFPCQDLFLPNEIVSAFIKLNGRLVTQLDFWGTQIPNNLTIPIIQSCQNIEIINFEHTQITTGEVFKNKFKKVHTLTVPSSKELSYRSFVFFDKHFNNVKNLNLNFSHIKGGGLVFFDAIKSYFPKLESIDLGDIEIKEALDMGNEVEDEYVYQTNVVIHAKNKWIQENPHVLKKIRTFKLSGYGNGAELNDDSFKHILKSFPNLKCLELSRFCTFSFDNLIKSQTTEDGVCNHFLTFEEFKFGSEKVTIDGMRQLVTLCPNLRRIYVDSQSHEAKYANVEVLEVFASLKNLEFLFLDCYGTFDFKAKTFTPEERFGYVGEKWGYIEYTSQELEDLSEVVNEKFQMQLALQKPHKKSQGFLSSDIYFVENYKY